MDKSELFNLMGINSLDNYVNIHELVVPHVKDQNYIQKINKLEQILDLEFNIRTIIHDISTPITSININTDFLFSLNEKSAQEDDLVGETLKSIKDQLNRLKLRFEDIRFQKIKIGLSENSKNEFLEFIQHSRLYYNETLQIFINEAILDASLIGDTIDIYIIIKLLRIDNLAIIVLNLDQELNLQIQAISLTDDNNKSQYKILNLNEFSGFHYTHALFNRILPKYNKSYSFTKQEQCFIFNITAQKS